VANLAWEFAIKEGFHVFDSLLATKPLVRSYGTWARRGPILSRSYGAWPRPGAAPEPPRGDSPHQPAGDGPGSLLRAGKDHGCPVEFSDFPAQTDSAPSARAEGESSSSLKQLCFAAPTPGWGIAAWLWAPWLSWSHQALGTPGVQQLGERELGSRCWLHSSNRVHTLGNSNFRSRHSLPRWADERQPSYNHRCCPTKILPSVLMESPELGWAWASQHPPGRSLAAASGWERL